MNLLAAHGDIAVCDFHGMGIVAVSGNLDAAAGDGRTGFAFTVVDGQAVVVQSTIARGDAGQPCKFTGQLDVQAIASGVLDHTDVATRQLRRIRAAGQLHGFAQASGDLFSIIPGKVPAAQLADFRLSSLTGKGLHIADIGRVGIIAVIAIDNTALDVSDVFATSVNAIAVNRDTASLDGAIIAEIHIFVQSHLDGAVVNGSLDVAFFFYRPISFIGGIALDLDGLAKVLFHNLVIAFFIRRQSEATALSRLGDTAGDTALHQLQLFFRSRPALGSKVWTNGGVLQARNAVNAGEVLGQSDIKAIVILIGDNTDILSTGKFGFI
ncbi:MAG: hypothetical protein MSH67_08015, partial [Mitsuokella jalaludinii]|nr:hypothetical protein [Mitsuokella jalaludinii]